MSAPANELHTAALVEVYEILRGAARRKREEAGTGHHPVAGRMGDCPDATKQQPT